MDSELDSNNIDLQGALKRALAALEHSDPKVRNDARAFLELATIFRHVVSIEFEGLAVASPEQRRDAMDTLSAVSDLDRQAKAMRREMIDWTSIDLIDGYAMTRMRSRRNDSLKSSAECELITDEENSSLFI
jgi:hypothetical protein